MKKRKQKKKRSLKKWAISIAITASIAVTIFHFDIQIGSLVEFAGNVNIDVTTTIYIQ